MTQPLTNQTSRDLPPSHTLESDEISLIDILRFIQRRFPIIGGTTLAMVLLGLAASLVYPPEFRREILLDFEIPTSLETAGLSIDDSSIEALAEFDLQTYLREYQANLENQPQVSGTVESVSSSETPDSPTHLSMSLRATTPEALEAFRQSAYQRIQTTTDETIQEELATEVERLDASIAKTQNKLDFFREQISTASALPPNIIENSELFYALQFQEQQSVLTQTLGDLANQQFERENLVALQSQAGPLVEVTTLADIQTQQSTPLKRNLVLSAVTGIMLGVLIGVVVDQISRLQQEPKRAKSVD